MTIYYNPEHYGVKKLDELQDPNASYSFDDVLLLQDYETGRIGFLTDSGCSCPLPFEDLTRDDITWVDSEEGWEALLNATSRRKAYYYEDGESDSFYDPPAVSEFLKKAALGRWDVWSADER